MLRQSSQKESLHNLWDDAPSFRAERRPEPYYDGNGHVSYGSRVKERLVDKYASQTNIPVFIEYYVGCVSYTPSFRASKIFQSLNTYLLIH